MTIHPDDYRFTLSEVVGENKDRSMNLRNWMARDVIKVGQKHKLGRWLFSLSDIIRIRIVEQLTDCASMPPADANRYADLAVERYRQLVLGDEGHRLLTQLPIGSKEGRRYLFIRPGFSAGGWALSATRLADGKFTFDEGDQFSNEQMLERVCHVVIPVDEIIGGVVMNFEIDTFVEENGDWDLMIVREGLDEGDQWDEQRSLNGMIAWYRHSDALSQAAQA